mgnify:CR=1 FL=1
MRPSISSNSVWQTPQADTLTWWDQLGTMVQNSRTLRPGDCEVYLPLAESPSVRMRINPGQRTGIFRVSAVEVLEFGRTRCKGPPRTTDALPRPDATELIDGAIIDESPGSPWRCSRCSSI